MDASHWNDRYATAEYVWKADPNVFLVAETEGLACGEGRNAVWLAEQGWDATGRALAAGATLLVVAHDSANLNGGIGGP